MKSTGVLIVSLTTLVILLSICPFGSKAAVGTKPGFEFYGFIKGDIVYNFKRMKQDYASVMRPSQILIRGENTP